MRCHDAATTERRRATAYAPAALALALAGMACAGAQTARREPDRRAPPPPRTTERPSSGDAPTDPPPAVDTTAIDARPTAAPAPTSAWTRVQRHLPALAGADADHTYALVGAYAVAVDPEHDWARLADELDAGDGGLGRTCIGDRTHVLALLIDDPAESESIGALHPDVRVFWLPLEAAAASSIDAVIRDAGLVDGPDATAEARRLRVGRSRSGWLEAMSRAEVWFLPAGDDPTIHHRRIRGYAVARVADLRPYVVYVGRNVIGGHCELATVRVDAAVAIAAGPVRSGGALVCDLDPRVAALPECQR